MPKAVLIIDDESLVTEIYGEYLRMKKIQVHVASNARDGIRKFIKHRDEIGVIIIDNAMPDIFGIELAKIFRRRKIDVPMFIFAGFISDELIREVNELNIRYLQKPASLVDFLNFFQRFLN